MPLLNCPVPTISAINGASIVLGLELFLTDDAYIPKLQNNHSILSNSVSSRDWINVAFAVSDRTSDVQAVIDRSRF